MMKLLKYLAIIAAGAFFGIFSALWMSGLVGNKALDNFFNIQVSGWNSDWTIGMENANPYIRARVARYGLLALSKQEAVYFIRKVDDDGDMLRQSCRYELSGGGQEAYWWSITLYDKESLLPINRDEALSIDATQIGAAEKWTAIIATEKPDGNRFWISSRNAGQFDLMLRLYRPAQSVLDDPEATLNPPHIRRIGCAAGDGR